MPVLAGIPWLVPLLTAVSAAGTLAATGYQLAQGSPGSGAEANAVKQQQDLQKQQEAQMAAQRKVAFLAAQPNVQAQTGGSLTGNAFNVQSATEAGLPSNLDSIAKYLGANDSGGGSAPISGGTTTPNSGQQTPGDLSQLSDLLKAA